MFEIQLQDFLKEVLPQLPENIQAIYISKYHHFWQHLRKTRFDLMEGGAIDEYAHALACRSLEQEFGKL